MEMWICRAPWRNCMAHVGLLQSYLLNRLALQRGIAAQAQNRRTVLLLCPFAREASFF